MAASSYEYYYRELGEWDWYVLPTWRRIHYATLEEYTQPGGVGYSPCGRRGEFWIPGLFARMSLPRCKRCCRALGFPVGTGSPKNDDACRPLAEARIKRLPRSPAPPPAGPTQ